MSKNEFLDRLAWLLADISPEERDAALTYYREYIEDAGTANEEAVLQELGSPEEIAAAIKEDPAYKASRQPLTSIPAAYSQKKDSTPLIITIVLAVILSPIWIPVLVTLLCTIAGILLGAIFGGIGCMLAGIGLLIAAIVCMFKSTLLISFSLLGAAFVVTAIGIILMLFGIWLCATVIPWCAKGTGNLFHKLFSQNKEVQA